MIVFIKLILIQAYCIVYRFLLLAGPLLIAVLLIELKEATRKIKVSLLIVCMSVSECEKCN